MCGLICVFGDGASAIPDQLILQAGEVMTHRGPDSTSVRRSADGRFVALHHRLAIIDPRAGANQPMQSPETGALLAFNGEIYNFRELPGVDASTTSDTRAMIQYLDRADHPVLDDWRGMFAGVYYRAGALTVFRDHAGKKPLFAYLSPWGLILASELSGIVRLMHLMNAPLPLDRQGVYSYLMGGGFDSYRTMVRGVIEVPPESLVQAPTPDEMLARMTGTVTAGAQFCSPLQAEQDGREEDFDAVFLKAVERRLVSDYPVACLLSGGLDSLAVAAALHELGAPVTFFTLSSPHNQAEVAVAREAAHKFGMPHVVEDMRAFTPDAALSTLARLDQPLGDSSILNVDAVMQVLSRQFRVCLTGDGGDELFGGYEQYRWFSPRFSLQINGVLSARLVTAAARLGRQRLTSTVAALMSPILASQQFYSRFFTPQLLKKVVPNATVDDTARARAAWYEYFLSSSPQGDAMSCIGYADYFTVMRELILVKVDRGSMLNSVEVRSPLLDVDVGRMACHMAYDRKVDAQGRAKLPIRHFVKQRLGDLGQSLPKTGFGVDLGQVVSDMKAPFLEQFSQRLEPLGFDLDEVARLYRHGRWVNNSKRIFALLSLAVWLDRGAGKWTTGSFA